ncbi:MAG: hypothetical protein A2167_05500 [Planctomycetes bacterium RBG_13_46_10]|nr:MAG: hypothetical protein A2167_05500 [Planctomycetes bacterium RBG_13_46_10]
MPRKYISLSCKKEPSPIILKGCKMERTGTTSRGQDVQSADLQQAAEEKVLHKVNKSRADLVRESQVRVQELKKGMLLYQHADCGDNRTACGILIGSQINTTTNVADVTCPKCLAIISNDVPAAGPDEESIAADDETKTTLDFEALRRAVTVGDIKNLTDLLKDPQVQQLADKFSVQIGTAITSCYAKSAEAMQAIPDRLADITEQLKATNNFLEKIGGLLELQQELRKGYKESLN